MGFMYFQWQQCKVNQKYFGSPGLLEWEVEREIPDLPHSEAFLLKKIIIVKSGYLLQTLHRVRQHRLKPWIVTSPRSRPPNMAQSTAKIIPFPGDPLVLQDFSWCCISPGKKTKKKKTQALKSHLLELKWDLIRFELGSVEESITKLGAKGNIRIAIPAWKKLSMERTMLSSIVTGRGLRTGLSCVPTELQSREKPRKRRGFWSKLLSFLEKWFEQEFDLPLETWEALECHPNPLHKGAFQRIPFSGAFFTYLME